MILLLCTFLAFLGAGFITRFGSVLGLTDYPNSRSSHRKPTPKGGGIGILAAFLFLAFYDQFPWYFWLPITGISFLGFIGDRVEISPLMRLFLQFFLVGILMVDWVLNQETGPLFQILIFLFVLVYITGTANFYNFMDGINGIAGITGIVAFGLLALYCRQYSFSSWFYYSLGMALACLGFLPFNLPKARCFMGDVGSILLGTVFAYLVVRISENWTDFICLASFLFTFYADELTTMAERILQGEKLTEAHRKHLYQVLVNEMKSPHWKVSFLYGAIQFGVGLGSFRLFAEGFFQGIFFLTAVLIVFLILSYKIKKLISLSGSLWN